MGQRLVAVAYDGGQPVCSCYWHWRAYTESAVEAVNEFISCWNDEPSDVKSSDRVLAAARAFSRMNEGCGVDAPDYADFAQLTPGYDELPEGTNRNDGLISLVPNTMDDQMAIADGIVFIYLDDEAVDFDVLWTRDEIEYDDLDDFEQAAWDEAWKAGGIGIQGVPFSEFPSRMADMLSRMSINPAGFCKVSSEQGDLVAEKIC